MVDTCRVWVVCPRLRLPPSLDRINSRQFLFETQETKRRYLPGKLPGLWRADTWVLVERLLHTSRNMNVPHPALVELEHIVDQCSAVQRYLETDLVDVSLVMRAERNLYDEALAVLATLARSAEQTIAFEELTRRADQLKLGGNREQRLKCRCLELLGMLCEGDVELEVLAWLSLMALADLGRVVWALRLTDCTLERKGPAWARQMVERVRKQALGMHRVASGSAAIDDRTVQLGAKLALERVLFSTSCQEDLKKAVTVLLRSVKTNIERIDAPSRARPLPRSRRQAHAGLLRDRLTRTARARDEQPESSLERDCR